MTLEQLYEQVEHLPIPEKWKLIRHLLDDLEEREPTHEDVVQGLREGLQDAVAGRVHPAHEVFAEMDKDPSQEDWASFVNRMYGALADDPIERPPQLPLTEREPID